MGFWYIQSCITINEVNFLRTFSSPSQETLCAFVVTPIACIQFSSLAPDNPLSYALPL